MERFFNPRSVAIIGASEDRKKVGGIILENLLKNNFSGKIFPINPHGGSIQGLPAFEQISEVEGRIDLAVIAVPAEKVLEVAKQCAERKDPIKNLIIISSGFGESDTEGKIREKQLADLVKEYDLKIIGPNCLGIINPWADLNLSFAGAMAKRGKIGLIMQSGAFVSAFLDWSEEKSIGFSSIVTIGNKTFLQETDFLEYLAQDKNTKIIGMYLEGLSSGKKLCHQIKKISLQKPVLILMAEGGQKTQQAAISHTAAMAGESLIIRKALEKSGALVFTHLREFWLTMFFLNHFQLPLNEKILLVTNAGGPAVVATGLIEKSKHLDLFNLSEEQKKSLNEFLPASAAVNNPIDILGDADEERYRKVLEKIKDFSGVGAVLVLLTRQKQTRTDEIAKVLKLVQAKCNFPILPVFMTEKKYFANSAGDAFSFFEEVLVGLEVGMTLKSFQERNLAKKVKMEKLNKERMIKAKNIFQKAHVDNRRGFYFAESVRLLKLYNFKTVIAEELRGEGIFLAKKINFPVVLKVDDPEIIHKNAHSGVILDIENKLELKKQRNILKKRFAGKRMIVQPQLKSDLEIILGFKNDPVLGIVVLCGLGGVATEFLGEKLFFFPEIEDPDFLSELENSLLGRLLKKKKISLEYMAREIEKISCLAKENPWIREMDINPLLVSSNQDFIAVDIKILF